MHCVGCLWNYICQTDRYWIPPLDWVNAGNYSKIYRFYDETDFYKYLINLYNAVLFLGGNEMGPR